MTAEQSNIAAQQSQPKLDGDILRHELYVQRTEGDRAGFFQDIKEWREKLPETNHIKHHVGQFEKFSEKAYKRLRQDYTHDTIETATSFQSRVIGALTAQWSLLRQVAAQRLEGSPYQPGLQELDQEAARYYWAVYEALPESSRTPLALSPPLIYLGRLAELSFFNNQIPAPALISIPFGAIYDSPKSRGRLAIAHEIGHAVFNRLRPFLPELTEKARAGLKKSRTQSDKMLEQNLRAVYSEKEVERKVSHSSRKLNLIHETIVNWLGEIVADLVGAALAGPKFGMSALEVLALPEAVLGITDEVHPVAIIRPYIDLTCLEFLSQNVEFDEAYLQEYKKLEKQVERFSQPHLKRQLETIPALTLISLAEVKDEMIEMIRIVLDTELAALDNQKLGSIIIACAEKAKASTDLVSMQSGELPTWGESPLEEGEPFVLDLSNMLAPEYANPASFSDWYCCITRRCRCRWG